MKNLADILGHVEAGLRAFSQGFEHLATAAKVARIDPESGIIAAVKDFGFTRADHNHNYMASAPAPVTPRIPTTSKPVVIQRIPPVTVGRTTGFPREFDKTSFDYQTTIDFFGMVGKEYKITGNGRGKRSLAVSRYRYEKVKVIATRQINNTDPRKEIAAVLLTGADFGTILHFNRHELTEAEESRPRQLTDLKIAGLTYEGDMDEHPWIGKEVRLKEQDKMIPEIGTIIEAENNTSFKIELVDKSRNIQCIWLSPQYFHVLESES
jgi:hypothetical protein